MNPDKFENVFQTTDRESLTNLIIEISTTISGQRILNILTAHFR